MPNDPQFPALSGCRVLLSGAAGSIGRMLRPLLAPHVRELRLADRQRVAVAHPHETAYAADLTAPEACDSVVAGVDAIVHMAGYAEEPDWGTLLQANVVVVTALWEAAVRAGVDRTSSPRRSRSSRASRPTRAAGGTTRALELGYRPRHGADAFIAALEDKVEGDPVAERYQGGPYAALEFTGGPSRPARRR